MRGARRKRREREAELDAQGAAAMADVTCPRCGNTYDGQAALQIHREGGRCLPGDVYGQLVRLPDGRYGRRWRHPEIRS